MEAAAERKRIDNEITELETKKRKHLQDAEMQAEKRRKAMTDEEKLADAETYRKFEIAQAVRARKLDKQRELQAWMKEGCPGGTNADEQSLPLPEDEEPVVPTKEEEHEAADPAQAAATSRAYAEALAPYVCKILQEERQRLTLCGKCNMRGLSPSSNFCDMCGAANPEKEAAKEEMAMRVRKATAKKMPRSSSSKAEDNVRKKGAADVVYCEVSDPEEDLPVAEYNENTTTSAEREFDEAAAEWEHSQLGG